TALGYSLLAYTLAAQQRDFEAEEQLTHAADTFAQARPHFAASGLERASGLGQLSPLTFLAALQARHGKPELAWQRFEQGLGRGTWDDLTARLARSPADQARLAELGRGLEGLDLILGQYGAIKRPTQEQMRQHRERLAQRRQTQEKLENLKRELAKKL